MAYKIHSLNGVGPNVARKIAADKFGDNYSNMIINEGAQTFDFYLKDEKDEECKKELRIKIKEFRQRWGSNFRVYVVQNEN